MKQKPEICRGWRCPHCGSRELHVTFTGRARLIQMDERGEDYSTEDDGDHEWSNGSMMSCDDCGHAAPGANFQDAARLFHRRKLYTHCDHRPGQVAYRLARGVGRRRSMDRLAYADGSTYDAYPGLYEEQKPQ